MNEREAFDSKQEFYVHRKGTFTGNAPSFWAKGGSGYTAYVNNAERFSAEDAYKLYKDDPTKWELFNCDAVDARLHLVFDIQDKKLLGTDALCPSGRQYANQAALASQEPVAWMVEQWDIPEYEHQKGFWCEPTLMFHREHVKELQSDNRNFRNWQPLYTSPQAQPDLQDANSAFEICKKIAMGMPLNIKEHTEYRQSDDCKAMAWDIACAIDQAMKAKG
jgi:hypothetical protein